MKLYGILGKGTGKLGSSVFAISGGEQIMREYNPEVSNPNTEAQVAQRAKLKLMSQLAASMAGQIAFRKDGLVSARNKFIQANIGKCTFSENVASVDLATLDITGGSIGLPALADSMGSSTGANLALSSAAPANIDKVVYVLYEVVSGEQLNFIAEEEVSTPGASRTFEKSVVFSADRVLVLAYGIHTTSVKASSRFDNYEANENHDKAILDVLRSLTATDYVLSQTRGANIEVGE